MIGSEAVFNEVLASQHAQFWIDIYSVIMRSGIYMLACLFVAQSAVCQTDHGASCAIPMASRETVARLLELALSSAKQIGSDSDFDRSQLIDHIAAGWACLGDFRKAAELSDAAYPSGSESADELGEAGSRHLEQVPGILAEMKHGADSFLYGLVTGLAEEGKIDLAESWISKIPAPEVREEASYAVTEALYRSGKKDAAYRRLEAKLQGSAKENKRVSMDEMKFELAVSTNDWSEAHKLLSTMPAGTGKRFSLAMMASKEAEAGASQAEADLIEAAKEYDAKHDPPYEGYLIASHLAALRDYDHALQAAEKVRDDEWNAKAWSSIAAFQAVDRKVTEAKMSIAWIGKGELEHALGDPEHRRDMAKVFVASALSTAGHPDMALALLADRETKADDFVIDREFELEKVHALASKGDISAARMLVEKSLSHVVVVDDNESSLAWLLVENWYRIQSADAEQWIQLQQNASIRSTSWLAAASVALKSNPQPVYYFMNWD